MRVQTVPSPPFPDHTLTTYVVVENDPVVAKRALKTMTIPPIVVPVLNGLISAMLAEAAVDPTTLKTIMTKWWWIKGKNPASNIKLNRIDIFLPDSLLLHTVSLLNKELAIL